MKILKKITSTLLLAMLVIYVFLLFNIDNQYINDKGYDDVNKNSEIESKRYLNVLNSKEVTFKYE